MGMELTRRSFIKSAAALAAGPVVAMGAANVLNGKAYIYGDRPVRTIPRELYGTAVEWRADVSGLWRIDLDDFDPGVVQLGKDLRAGLVRFPGGFLSDFYHWRTGIGDRHGRSEVPAWTGGPLTYPYIGTDAMLEFVDRLDSQL
jgi:alpha-L-arabinofuranosidase